MFKILRFIVFSLLVHTAFLGLMGREAEAYPTPKFKDVFLYSTQNSEGSIFTQFYATISGPSPEDVASFTATGPSGTFYLTPSISFREWGLCYYYKYSEETGIIEPGVYTFQITDSTGRSATVVRNFSYDGPLPLVDSKTVSPANYSYLGTTTPTLSFDAVSGSAYYSIQIRDYDGKAAWYVSPNTTSTSFTVPSGLLQPNSAYYWWVRVRNSGTNPQKESISKTFYFYTGTRGNPALTSKGIMSLLVGDSFQYLLNYAWAMCENVAPWDVEAFKATGPDSTLFNLANARSWTFFSPNGNNGQLYLDPPTQSIPDGTYTIEITDESGNKNTTTTEYAYNPVPDFSSDTRVPAENAYFDTATPSFSWSRVTGDTGDGSYRYTIRIVDYADRIRWYDSPSSADTSFTLPESINLPRGSSYKWRVNVYGPAASGGTDSNNYRMSTYRTFTISAPTNVYVDQSDATCGGKSPCYTSIQQAINAVTTESTVNIAQGTYQEYMGLNASKSVILKGGWDALFTSQTPNSTFIRSPEVNQGSLTLHMLTVKPL